MTIRTCIRLSVPAAALGALLLAATLVTAQTPASPTASSPAPASPAPTAMPISLPVTVVDKKGDPVKNFNLADLTLTDNGHLQTIASFAIAQPSPTVFGILGQTSTNLKTELGDERLASVHFVDHTLPGTDDKAFVVQFAREVDLLEDPTANVNKLHDAANQLGSPQFGNQSGNQNNGDSSDQNSGEHRAGGLGGTLYDAIYLSANEILKKQPGQHVIILISDGIDRDSKETVNDAIEAAQAAHAAIFAIYYKGEEERTNPEQGMGRHGGMGGSVPGGGGGYPGGGGGYPGGGGGGRRGGGQTPSSEPHVDGKEILEHLCSATGGYMIEARRDKADEAYAKISALLKYQYTLSYTPDKEAADSVSHHLTLTSKKNDVWALVQQDYSTQ